jgi:hypothetical protein
MTLDSNDVTKIWQPDLYIENMIDFKVQEVLEPLRQLYVGNDSSVWHEVSVDVTVGCSMDFEKFPMDTQTCPVIVSFYNQIFEFYIALSESL